MCVVTVGGELGIARVERRFEGLCQGEVARVVAGEPRRRERSPTVRLYGGHDLIGRRAIRAVPGSQALHDLLVGRPSGNLGELGP